MIWHVILLERTTRANTSTTSLSKDIIQIRDFARLRLQKGDIHVTDNDILMLCDAIKYASLGSSRLYFVTLQGKDAVEQEREVEKGVIFRVIQSSGRIGRL